MEEKKKHYILRVMTETDGELNISKLLTSHEASITKSVLNFDKERGDYRISSRNDLSPVRIYLIDLIPDITYKDEWEDLIKEKNANKNKLKQIKKNFGFNPINVNKEGERTWSF